MQVMSDQASNVSAVRLRRLAVTAKALLSSQSNRLSFREGFVVASVDLTFEQILEAARQLPEAQRKGLVQALKTPVTQEQVLELAKRVRPTFRMDAKKRKRMSLLLQKGNGGKLTPDQGKELEALVAEFEINTLEMARAIADSVKSDWRQRGGNGRTGR